MHIFHSPTHVKQLLLVTFWDTTAGIGASFQTHTRTHTLKGHPDLEVMNLDAGTTGHNIKSGSKS